ncbi:MAG: hypothetical protein QW166_01865, partial [Candidatus Bathyarchaeia archaeon]
MKLQTFPTNLEHAIKLVNKIKFLAQTSMPEATFKEENMSIKVVSPQTLKKDHTNLFKYIASQQQEIDEAWNKITIKAVN